MRPQGKPLSPLGRQEQVSPEKSGIPPNDIFQSLKNPIEEWWTEMVSFQQITVLFWWKIYFCTSCLCNLQFIQCIEILYINWLNCHYVIHLPTESIFCARHSAKTKAYSISIKPQNKPWGRIYYFTYNTLTIYLKCELARLSPLQRSHGWQTIESENWK